jgi:hypothetical protein
MERIEKLLHELQYEVERGMMERDIDETITFGFFVPMSSRIPDGVVKCSFVTRPIPRYEMASIGYEPRLRLVKGGT